MKLRLTSTAILDPVKESETVKLYERDDGWKKIGESTAAIVFEHIIEVSGEVEYFPSDGGENDSQRVDRTEPNDN